MPYFHAFGLDSGRPSQHGGKARVSDAEPANVVGCCTPLMPPSVGLCRPSFCQLFRLPPKREVSQYHCPPREAIVYACRVSKSRYWRSQLHDFLQRRGKGPPLMHLPHHVSLTTCMHPMPWQGLCIGLHLDCILWRKLLFKKGLGSGGARGANSYGRPHREPSVRVKSGKRVKRERGSET